MSRLGGFNRIILYFTFSILSIIVARNVTAENRSEEVAKQASSGVLVRTVEPPRVFRTMKEAREAGEVGVRATGKAVESHQINQQKGKSMGAGTFTWFGPMDIVLLIGVVVGIGYYLSLKSKKKQKAEDRD